jgi:hypothetical protein
MKKLNVPASIFGLFAALGIAASVARRRRQGQILPVLEVRQGETLAELAKRSDAALAIPAMVSEGLPVVVLRPCMLVCKAVGLNQKVSNVWIEVIGGKLTRLRATRESGEAFTLPLVALLVMILTGCAAHTANTPLGAGKTVYDASFGGPVIEVFGADVPAPQLNLGARHGLRPNMDISGHAYLTALVYRVAGGDFELTSYPNEHLAFGIGASGFASLRSGVSRRTLVVPETTLASAWGPVYFGEQAALTTDGPLFSPFFGGRYGMLLAEARWSAANRKSDDVAVTYVPVRRYGAVGVILGVEVAR